MKLVHAHIGKGEYRFFLGSKLVAEVKEVKETALFYPCILTTGSHRKRGNALPGLKACEVWITNALNHEGHLKEVVNA